MLLYPGSKPIGETVHDRRRAELRAWRQRYRAARRDYRGELRPHGCAMGRSARADRAPAGHKLELSGIGRAGGRLRRRAAGARPRARRPRRHLVAEQRRMGDYPVRYRQGRAHPGQYQSILPAVGGRIRPQQGGLPGGGHGDVVQDQRLYRHGQHAGAGVAHLRAGPPARGEAAASGGGHPDRRAASARRVGVQRRPRPWLRAGARATRRAVARAAIRRSDQHPIHLGDDRRAEGRHADPSQHPEQRFLHRRGNALHRAGPAVHPRPDVSLLRHGARRARLHHPRRGNGVPR